MFAMNVVSGAKAEVKGAGYCAHEAALGCTSLPHHACRMLVA
jgi:hypothetical protein